MALHREHSGQILHEKQEVHGLRRHICRIISFLVFILLVFNVLSCGSKKTEENESSKASSVAAFQENGTETESEKEENKIRVGYITRNTEHSFCQEINQYAEKVFDGLEKEGIIASWTGVLDGGDQPDIQSRLAKKCIDEKCDYVFLIPAEAEASDPAVTLMAEAGIKVIVLNSKTASTDEKAWAYCGSDEQEAGKLVGKYVSENCPGSGKYIHISYISGSMAHIGFSQGFQQVLEKESQLELVSDSGFSAVSQEMEEVTDIVKISVDQWGEELRAIVCDTDEVSAAAQLCCNEIGYPDILCVGMGGSQTALDMVEKGEMKATFIVDGTGQLQRGIDCMLEDIDGKILQSENGTCRQMEIPCLLVTGE